jgi:hypothetical protein
VGMEIDKEYVEMSRRNIKAAAKELKRGSK